MSSPLIHLILLSAITLILCIAMTTRTGNNNEIDRQALLQIKARVTHDPLNVMGLWNETTGLHFCQWHGVTCGHHHHRVMVLDLSWSKLKEYGLANEVSTHGDVYSFGILLPEMFTGKRPTDDMFKEGLSLHKFVKAALPEQVTKILDHAPLKDLVDDHNTETRHAYNSRRTIANTNRILEAIISVREIALALRSSFKKGWT